MIKKVENLAEMMACGVDRVRKAKRNQHVLTDWFVTQQIKRDAIERLKCEGKDPSNPACGAEMLCEMAARIPISITPGAAIAGSQDCAFSPSYALINPSFRVEDFAGYCDPTAIYNDIQPCEQAGITSDDIDDLKNYWERSEYVRRLKGVYAKAAKLTNEVVFFMEPVTGHTIPDFRAYLAEGVDAMRMKFLAEASPQHKAMAEAIKAVGILAERYARLARSLADDADENDATLYAKMADALRQISSGPARNLHEAVQLFAVLWQVMVLEQAPNPYAFSAGNIDRIFQPYYAKGGTTPQEAVELVRNLLCFFQVADRCWAISQNIMVGGKGADGGDLTCDMTYIVLDAFYRTNDPQPALSVKVHSGTPEKLQREMGRFFFTPGHSTPSLFNDDVMFEMLSRQCVADSDLPDYSIAGCQEPLIMGKSSLNTTNTWLNLAKVLELACNDGKSLLTGKQLLPCWSEMGYENAAAAYENLYDVFKKYLCCALPVMEKAGNECTTLLGEYNPVPFTSAVMDGLATGRDMRDSKNPGCRYNASGCLIHGLSVVADSISALSYAVESGFFDAEEIRAALQNNYAGFDEVREFLDSQEKFGNGDIGVDALAGEVAGFVADRIDELRNNAGNAFLADFSTPSTHLLYGHWVGATPDGRAAREMLGYGVDGQFSHLRHGFEAKCISAWRLPFLKMTGGYASHIGIPADAARGESLADKGQWMWDRVVKPYFRLGDEEKESPFYVYFNIDSSDNLRAVLAEPEKYAPDGIYIMRIHGTFVNFLDLSPAIQEDIILRLEAGSMVQ